MQGRGRTTAIGCALVLVVAAAALAGCRPVPQPATVDLLGDSLTVESFWGRDAAWRAAGVGLPADVDLVRDAHLGAHFETPAARELARATDPEHPRPAVLVIALGLNNATLLYGEDGWTRADEQAFDSLLRTPHPSACVVVVLPAMGPAAAQLLRDHLAIARVRMKDLASRRARTVVVDWAPVVAAHPDYLDADGTHLAETHVEPGQLVDAEPADAYASLLWSGVARCASLPG